jgi:hypothetical protein
MPIDYPTNPDVSVDDYPIPFKERGLRGKPGSAPPFDLDKGTRGLAKVPGRMVGVTMGHSGPSVGKKKEVSKVSPTLPTRTWADGRNSFSRWSTARSLPVWNYRGG